MAVFWSLSFVTTFTLTEYWTNYRCIETYVEFFLTSEMGEFVAKESHY